MNKNFSVKRLLTLAFAMASLPSMAYDFAVDGICFNIIDDSLHTAVVAMPEDNGEEGGVLNYKGDIIVPATVTSNGITYSVCGVAESAFDNADAVRSIQLPEGIASIGNRAFYGCGVKTFTLPASVIHIGSKAFSACTKLENFIVTDGNTKYKSNNGILFSADGQSLIAYPSARNGDYHVPEGVKIIGDGAFAQCLSLQKVILPEGIETIGIEAFLGDRKLKDINFPASLVNIGEDALTLTKWESSQPDGVVYIGKVAYKYSGKTKEMSLTFLPGTRSIASKAFSGNEIIKSVTIPAGCTSIGDWAFSDCSALETVVLPSADVHIGWSSFSNTPFFENHPDGMVIIGKTACGVKGEISDSATIAVPEGCEVLASGALDNADMLAFLTLPSTIKSIESNSLTGASSLISISLAATTPPEAVTDIAGDDFFENVTLIVPASSLEAYRQHPVWKKFNNIKTM